MSFPNSGIFRRSVLEKHSVRVMENALIPNMMFISSKLHHHKRCHGNSIAPERQSPWQCEQRHTSGLMKGKREYKERGDAGGSGGIRQDCSSFSCHSAFIFYFFIFHHQFGQRLCSVRLVLLIASALYLQCLSSLSDLSAVSVSLVSDWDSFGHCFKRNVLYVEVKVEPTGFQLLNCCTHVLKKMFSVSLCSS